MSAQDNGMPFQDLIGFLPVSTHFLHMRVRPHLHAAPAPPPAARPEAPAGAAPSPAHVFRPPVARSHALAVGYPACLLAPCVPPRTLPTALCQRALLARRRPALTLAARAGMDGRQASERGATAPAGWHSHSQVSGPDVCCTRTRTRARAHTHAHTHTHARTHTRIHARIHTQTHTHTHTARARTWRRSSAPREPPAACTREPGAEARRGHQQAGAEDHIRKITSYEHFAKDFIPKAAIGSNKLRMMAMSSGFGSGIDGRGFGPNLIRNHPVNI